MAKSRKRVPVRHGNTGPGRFVAGLAAGLLLALAGVVGYFYFGKPSIAVTDKPPVWEPLLSPVPLHMRARAEAKPAPFPATEEVFEGGAHTYRAHCGQCHGVPGHESALGRGMEPRAQQFFAPHERRAAAAQSAGELFWKTAFGIRRSGMPAYSHVLTNTQLWEVSLLLHSAGGELPAPVRAILVEGAPAPQPTTVVP